LELEQRFPAASIKIAGMQPQREAVIDRGLAKQKPERRTKRSSMSGRTETFVQLTGSDETGYRIDHRKKAGRPACGKRETAPHPATRYKLMDRLQDHTVFFTVRLYRGYCITAAT